MNAGRSGRRDVTADLAKAVGMNYVFGTSFQELGQGSSEEPAYHGQAILTTLPVRSARVIRFERQTKFWKLQPYRLTGVSCSGDWEAVSRWGRNSATDPPT